MNYRLRRLNYIALAIALTYALFIIPVVDKAHIAGFLKLLVVYVTSVGFYQLVVEAIYRIVAASPLLMRLYWGRLHVDGLWSYVYTVEGATADQIYFGIWRFEQDLYQTQVVGFGLTDDYQVRSHVRSVTDMVETGNVCEVINIRSDNINSAAEYYSRTTMYFEYVRSRWMRHPVRMRGKTFVYGGPLTGKICNNVFTRHSDALSEQDVIQNLQQDAKLRSIDGAPNGHDADEAE